MPGEGPDHSRGHQMFRIPQAGIVSLGTPCVAGQLPVEVGLLVQVEADAAVGGEFRQQRALTGEAAECSTVSMNVSRPWGSPNSQTEAASGTRG